MELRVLHYFLTVAREENITKAANLLHMTQPTLSRQIRALEEELNVKLLERYSHYVRLTEDGLLLRRHAQDILDLAEKMKQEFIGSRTLAGDIRIGCGDTQNMAVLAAWMAEFHRQYPLITFRVQSKTADVVQEQIENGLVDIGLLMEPVDVMKYEVLRMPLLERWGILVRESSALAEKENIHPDDLLEVPLILPERISVQSHLKHWFGETYENLHQVATYNLLLNTVYMVRSGLGTAICYDFHQQMTPGLRFIPLKGIGAVGAVLAWKKQQALSKAARIFLGYCHTCKDNAQQTSE
ncbi:LysR family transcriptional regulator [Pectinatus haikarae]|uniref:DNA-binding transcriptional LysR family regulator n=1 Tax=Pectinatus haikarae TaxID=349096 RepID=A0ABT9YBZ6_9FIRM|nr:LysR family transcriptional regulator [Pectinatus haikarae]MDQ0204747.1 DNA-binding transcriptional LysR family regulator [Pectinatus haikarae]